MSDTDTEYYKAEYYKFMKPTIPTIPDNTEYHGEEYKNFIITKEPVYFFWNIETLEHSPPPLELCGSWTTKEEAMRSIDEFHAREQRNKEAALKEGN